MALIAIVDRADDVLAWTKAVVARGVPAPPEWLSSLPLVGERISSEWRVVASTPPEDVAKRVAPYLAGLIAWLFAQAGGLGWLLIQFLLTVAVSAMLYAQGETAAAGVVAFARRLAGEQGARVVILSAGAIRAVALGIVVTALVQAAVGGIGLAVTGVGHPLLLACIMVVLGIAQIGPWPVLFGAVTWLYVEGQTFWGTVMLVWALLTTSLDNILRPILIKRGADLPLVLILAGVLGGLVAFGLVGLFVGPVILAVTYTLLIAWVAEGSSPAPGTDGTER